MDRVGAAAVDVAGLLASAQAALGQPPSGPEDRRPDARLAQSPPSFTLTQVRDSVRRARRQALEDDASNLPLRAQMQTFNLDSAKREDRSRRAARACAVRSVWLAVPLMRATHLALEVSREAFG